MTGALASSTATKFITVGDGTVGKTCMLICYTCNKFPTDYIPTVFDNFSANISVDARIVNLGLWDTAGQEDYNRLRPLSYRGADVFILSFSLISRASYENVQNKVHVAFLLNNGCQSFADLREDRAYLADHPVASIITTGQGEELRKEIGVVAYIECSSKTQGNIKAVFDTAIKVMLEPPRHKKVNKIQTGFNRTLRRYICGSACFA